MLDAFAQHYVGEGRPYVTIHPSVVVRLPLLHALGKGWDASSGKMQAFETLATVRNACSPRALGFFHASKEVKLEAFVIQVSNDVWIVLEKPPPFPNDVSESRLIPLVTQVLRQAMSVTPTVTGGIRCVSPPPVQAKDGGGDSSKGVVKMEEDSFRIRTPFKPILADNSVVRLMTMEILNAIGETDSKQQQQQQLDDEWLVEQVFRAKFCWNSSSNKECVLSDKQVRFNDKMRIRISDFGTNPDNTLVLFLLYEDSRRCQQMDTAIWTSCCRPQLSVMNESPTWEKMFASERILSPCGEAAIDSTCGFAAVDSTWKQRLYSANLCLFKEDYKSTHRSIVLEAMWSWPSMIGHNLFHDRLKSASPYTTTIDRLTMWVAEYSSTSSSHTTPALVCETPRTVFSLCSDI
jgi:hypothetical protein